MNTVNEHRLQTLTLERPQSRRTDDFVAKVNFRLVVTYLQFLIQVCFSILSVCRPRLASHAHFRHRQPSGLNCSMMSRVKTLVEEPQFVVNQGRETGYLDKTGIQCGIHWQHRIIPATR